MSPNLLIKQARRDELPLVLEVLDDAAAWLQAEGIRQWPESFSRDDTWRIDRIKWYIRQGCTYLIHGSSGEPVATFSLTRTADPDFAHGWPDGPGTGGYVFRIAVKRASSGNNLGAVILDWASAKAGRWGKQWLRLDIHRHNRKLQRYYQRCGFVKVAEITAPDPSTPGRVRESGTLLQRPTLITTAGRCAMTARSSPAGVPSPEPRKRLST